MIFDDRTQAGRALAQQLEQFRGPDTVVVGLPRGGVPVAAEVARALGAPLDVMIVRKVGVPFQPELAMGAIGEHGVRVVTADVVRAARVTDEEFRQVERRERAELERRAHRYRDEAPAIALRGRTVILVDDGLATGATARVACQVARAQEAGRVVLAVPVVPGDTLDLMRDVADQVVCLQAPSPFMAVGEFYDDFSAVSDAEVVDLLRRARAVTPAPGPVSSDPIDLTDLRAVDEEVELPIAGVVLGGRLTVPVRPVGLVLFAHGSGSSRFSVRNRFVAGRLNDTGFATLLFDLLTPGEESDRANVFDIELLAGRLTEATRWVRRQPRYAALPVGYFGASTGAGAALWAAAAPDREVAAIVSRGGRPDMAGPRLAAVRAPTLLIVGGHDEVVVGLNREAQAQLRCESRLEIVPSATHLFEEPGALAIVASLAAEWFRTHLAGVPSPAGGGARPSR